MVQNNDINLFKTRDNIINVFKTKLLFNICSNINMCQNKDFIIVQFGIFNDSFNSKIKSELFRKDEFYKLYDILENISINNKKYKTKLEFINATLEFNFDYFDNDVYLDLKYQIPNCGDDYIVNMNKKDIINLYYLLKKQIKK